MRRVWIGPALPLLLCQPARAAAPQRPTVGLVLSGGAALGLAHLGVIEWLETHRVPVDVIAGTSMGALIGAAYATGMSPAQIRGFLRHVRWEEAFRAGPPYSQLSFRRKEDAVAFPGGLQFGWRGGLKWPRGLLPSQHIGLLVSRVSLPHTANEPFDALPIPFRCVATDLGSGEEVVLGKGSLPLALRATISIPGIFAPVPYQGRLLADGGLVNNLPVDVAREMGARRTIAVFVGGRLTGYRGLESPTDILGRAVEILTRQNVDRNLRLADVALTPDLSGFGPADFGRVDALADAGYRAAETSAAQLQALALDEAEWRSYLVARDARRRLGEFTPAFVAVVGTEASLAAAIARSLRQHVGRPLAPLALEADLDAIAGCGRFESLLYERARRNGDEGLLVRVQEKTYGPQFGNALLDVDGLRPGGLRLSAPVRITSFGVGCAGSELRTDVVLGSRTHLSAEYYRPWGNAGWFAAPRVFTGYWREELSPSAGHSAEYSVRHTGVAFEVGRYEGRDAALRADLRLSRWSAGVRVGDPALPTVLGNGCSLGVSWVVDRQDGAVAPTRGVRLDTGARWHLRAPGTPDRYVQARADVSSFHPVGEDASLFTFASVGSTLGGSPSLVHRFGLDGPLRLGTCGRPDLRGSHRVLGGLGYRRRVSRLPPPLGGGIHLLAWYQHGAVFGVGEPGRSAGCVSGGVMAETMAGPLFVGVSWAGRSDLRLYLALGRFLKARGF